jgi:hypothetical protein
LCPQPTANRPKESYVTLLINRKILQFNMWSVGDTVHKLLRMNLACLQHFKTVLDARQTARHQSDVVGLERHRIVVRRSEPAADLAIPARSN